MNPVSGEQSKGGYILPIKSADGVVRSLDDIDFRYRYDNDSEIDL